MLSLRNLPEHFVEAARFELQRLDLPAMVVHESRDLPPRLRDDGAAVVADPHAIIAREQLSLVRKAVVVARRERNCRLVSRPATQAPAVPETVSVCLRVAGNLRARLRFPGCRTVFRDGL